MSSLALAESNQDMELVGRARAGDDAAFDSLFHRHKQMIFNVCLGILGSHEDATDATQSTFIQAFRALQSFRGDSEFRTWLYRIATNACLELIRKRKRQPESGLPTEIPDRGRACDERVWEAMLDLAPDVRAVLVLSYFQGLSGKDLATALGCSEGAARVRLHRARHLFKAKYEEVNR